MEYITLKNSFKIIFSLLEDLEEKFKYNKIYLKTLSK